MNRLARKVVDWVVGLSLISVGVIGGVIPFFPGWIAVLAGLAVLSSHSRLAHAIHTRMVEKGKQIGRWIRSKRDPDGAP